jgi:hypothetical protein
MDQTHSEVDSSNAHTPDTLPTLTEFLTQLKLLRYHAAFTSAGVADDDIPQLVLLEESDLRELLESIGMLPFHAIAFRSTLRLLRRQHSPKNAREVEHKSATPSPRLKVCIRLMNCVTFASINLLVLFLTNSRLWTFALVFFLLILILLVHQTVYQYLMDSD